MGGDMFEFVREAGQFFDALLAWIMVQPMILRLLIGAVALAVLWVIWIILRVFLLALRAAFRGL